MCGHHLNLVLQQLHLNHLAMLCQPCGAVSRHHLPALKASLGGESFKRTEERRAFQEDLVVKDLLQRVAPF